MYARVTRSNIQPGKTDDWTKYYRDNILPTVKDMKGFKGILMLAIRDSNRVMTVALWDTETDMKATETSGYINQVISSFKDSGIIPQSGADIEHYEVTLQEF